MKLLLDNESKKRIDELDYKNEIFQILELFGNSTPSYEHLAFTQKVIMKFPQLFQELLEIYKSS